VADKIVQLKLNGFETGIIKWVLGLEWKIYVGREGILLKIYLELIKSITSIPIIQGVIVDKYLLIKCKITSINTF